MRVLFSHKDDAARRMQKPRMSFFICTKSFYRVFQKLLNYNRKKQRINLERLLLIVMFEWRHGSKDHLFLKGSSSVPNRKAYF